MVYSVSKYVCIPVEGLSMVSSLPLIFSVYRLTLTMNGPQRQ